MYGLHAKDRQGNVVKRDNCMLECRYTANLAAFLTVRNLDTPIRGVEDLVGSGRAVATITPYLKRLARNHHIIASDVDGAPPLVWAEA